jgi:hypothetical protein
MGEGERFARLFLLSSATVLPVIASRILFARRKKWRSTLSDLALAWFGMKY